MNEAQDQPATDSMWSMDKPNARRSLLLCAAGALTGLAIAGFGLFTAQGTRTSVVPAEDVALINQVPILMSDYITQLRSLYDVSLSEATPDQKRQALEDMIREELYVQRGIELGMQTDTIEVRSALVGAIEAQATADAIMARPDEATLRAWYDSHQNRFLTYGRMALMDYLLPKDANAGEVVAALRAAGATPAAVTRLGLKSSGKADGTEEFYFDASMRLDDNVVTAAKQLRDGEVSDPITVPDGAHVVVMKTHHPPEPQRYEDVRAAVLEDYTAAQTKRLSASNDAFLRKRADILIAKGIE